MKIRPLEVFWIPYQCQKARVSLWQKVLFWTANKGNDPNPWFSGITSFSRLALWSLQIKKRSSMGCLFFDADFF